MAWAGGTWPLTQCLQCRHSSKATPNDERFRIVWSDLGSLIATRENVNRPSKEFASGANGIGAGGSKKFGANESVCIGEISGVVVQILVSARGRNYPFIPAVLSFKTSRKSLHPPKEPPRSKISVRCVAQLKISANRTRLGDRVYGIEAAFSGPTSVE